MKIFTLEKSFLMTLRCIVMLKLVQLIYFLNTFIIFGHQQTSIDIYSMISPRCRCSGITLIFYELLRIYFKQTPSELVSIIIDVFNVKVKLQTKMESIS